MGRRKMDWLELKNRGCKPCRWQARKREEESPQAGEASNKWLPERYRASLEKEEATFAQRCVANETICRNLDGTPFTWPKDHFLTEARDIARKIVSNPDYKWPETKAQCVDFLRDLETGASRNIFMDPHGADNAELLIAAYAKPSFKLYRLYILDLVEWFGWKDSTGNRILNDPDFFDPEIIEILNQGRRVLAAVQN